MTQHFKVGDKVRSESTGSILTVIKPDEKGYSYLVEQDNGVRYWENIHAIATAAKHLIDKAALIIAIQKIRSVPNEVLNTIIHFPEEGLDKDALS